MWVARAMGMRVERFSIGFGPALPFCQFRYGETTYKLAMVPLGGGGLLAQGQERSAGRMIEHRARGFLLPRGQRGTGVDEARRPAGLVHRRPS